jgi:hypothetical protein
LRKPEDPTTEGMMASNRTTQGLNRKLDQAAFLLQQMQQSAIGTLDFESYFAGCISALRSVILYVRTWLEQQGRIKRSDDSAWVKIIKPWENALPPDHCECWRCITRLRNKDIHEEPMIPFPHSGNFSSAFSIAFDANNDRIRAPESGKEYDVSHACRVSLDVARKLICDYLTL